MDNVAIAERIGIIKRNNNLSIQDIARASGISFSTVSSQLQGRRGISTEMLFGLTQLVPNINLSWILTGSGDCYITQTTNPDEINKKLTTIITILESKF